MKHKNNISKIIGYIVGGLIILFIIALAAYYLTPGSAQEKYSTMPVVRMDLTQAVTATGAVAPDQQSDLAFDGSGGTIASVNVAVGDHVKKGQVLTSLRSDILRSNLEGAQADVAAAQEQLATLQGGAKPADIALYSQKATDAVSALASIMHDAYLKTQDAVENKNDILFNNPVSVNPTIMLLTENSTISNNINQERLIAGEDLDTWLVSMNSDAAGTVSAATLSQASTTIAYSKKFLSDLSEIMNYLSPGNSGLSQSTIIGYRSQVNAAASELSAAESEFIGNLSGTQEAGATLVSQQSGGAASAVSAQSAAVAKAQAQADAIESQLNHSQLTAPFDGIVTDVEPTVGEVFSAGTPAITVISTGPSKIDIHVAETDVGKLSLGESASVTLNAYGTTNIFPAVITSIDPAQTTVNGVNSYLVTLHFTTVDPRVLSGMTANVSIVTASTTRALAVPQGSIINKGTQTYALVKNTDGQFGEKPVTVGITGSNGYVEVTSGLSENDMVASF